MIMTKIKQYITHYYSIKTSIFNVKTFLFLFFTIFCFLLFPQTNFKYIDTVNIRKAFFLNEKDWDKYLNKLTKNMGAIRAEQMSQAGGGFTPAVQRISSVNENEVSADKTAEQKFSYINENNIDDVAIIIANCSAKDAIAVLNNIPGYLSNRIFGKLSSTQQHELIELQKQIGFLQPDVVEMVDDQRLVFRRLKRP